MVEFIEDHGLAPGTWYLWSTGKVRILLACPDCGHVTSLDLNDGFEVSVFGIVSPSVKCQNVSCEFWDTAYLRNWKSF
jgi:hypothetical protein